MRWGEGAARSGLGQALFVDAGAGNAAALAEAADRLAVRQPELEVAALPWWTLAGIGGAGSVRGGRAESSVVLAVAPELVRADRGGSSEAPSADLGVELLERAAPQ